MKQSLIAVTAGVLLVPPAGELSSRYVVGEVRRTEVSFEETLSLIELKMIVEGEEIADAFEMEQTESSKGSVTFEDRIVKLEEGELDSFERSYVELGEEFSVHIADPLGEDLDERGVMTCPLEGKRVRFIRDEAGESFLAEFPEGEEGDPELLEGITTELPWAVLLPDEEVAEGDRWEIDPELFNLVMNFVRDLPYEFEQEVAEGFVEEEVVEFEEDELAEASEFGGKIIATWEGIESIEDVPHARINLAIELTIETEMTEVEPPSDEEPPDDLPPGMSLPEYLEMNVEVGFEGEGTLLWDLETGKLVSMKIDLEVEEIHSVVMLLEMEEGEERMEQTMVSEGTYRLEVSVE